MDGQSHAGLSGIKERLLLRSGKLFLCIACVFSLLIHPLPLKAQDLVNVYSYDARGRLVKAADQAGRVVEYQLDAAGNRVAVFDQTAETLTPVITSFVAPSTIASGAFATITWKSSHTTYCALAIFGDYSQYPNLPVNGSASVRISENTAVKITCYLSNLSVSASKIIRLSSGVNN